MCYLEDRYALKEFPQAFKRGDEWLNSYGEDLKDIILDIHSPFNSKNKIPYHI